VAAGSLSWPRRRHPLESNYSLLLENSRIDWPKRRKTPASARRHCSASWSDQDVAQRSHAKGKARIIPYEQMLKRRKRKTAKDLRSTSRPGRGLGNIVVEFNDCGKGTADKLSMKI
jgi:hypothetical protein